MTKSLIFILAGHIYEHSPHSIQRLGFNFFSIDGLLIELMTSFGMSDTGHTSLHLPHLMHGVMGFS